KESYFGRIGPGYFKALSTKVVAGREFDEHDTLTTTKVAIVNETFARTIASQSNILGKRLWKERTPTEPATVYEIVGVVKDTKYNNLREDFVPIVFLPEAQDPVTRPYDFFVLRISGSPAALIPTARSTFAQIHPEITTQFTVFKDQIQNS